ncbi:MAG: outer membrane beta-barrel protein [Pseudobacter sp.]|uniref:outer membrane beta-barrel protein n=1 Tax=Pseudobacter sp. TaxID=2045420 RepID=UPI003F814CB4
MRLSALLIAVLLLSCCALQAQRTKYGVVKGTVIDSASRQPVEAATISVFLVQDSSLINYVLTNRKGEFQVKEVPLGQPCHLLISFNGLKSYTIPFSISENKSDTLLPPIRLGKAVKELEEVMVVGQRPPMLVKKDTIEFNAGSFKTMPNAVLEDLVRQLPGIDVDKDGNLTMNGRKIEKITIDGKDFFGNDPQVALKNLPRNIIDKIQVADNKTKQNQFNKTTTGEENKILNLTLKKDQNRGWFGRFFGGYGSEERYEAGGNINMFNTEKQVSILANANNTNRTNYGGSGFSINNAQSSLGGGGSGFTDTKTGGLNFSNMFSKKLTMSSSYFFSRSAFENNTRTQRQYILAEDTLSIYDYNSLNSNSSTSRNHRLNIGIDYRPDTMTSLYLNASYGKTDGESGSVNDARSRNSKGSLLNTSYNELDGNSSGNNISAEFFIGRRFHKEGRNISLSLSYASDMTRSRDHNNGRLWLLKQNGDDSTDLINQRSLLRNETKGYGFTIGYAEPVAKNLSMLARYTYRVSDGISDKNTGRFNDATGQYDLIDTVLTDAFTNRTEISNPDISLNYLKENRFRGTVGFGMQWLRQKSTSLIQKAMDERYLNLFPTANISYQLSKKGEVSFYYNGSTQQPSPQQLQPVPDNSNPLYINMGNPDLRPSFSHSFSASIRQSTGKLYWFGTLNYGTTTNQIVTETYFDELRRQVSVPINMNGNHFAGGNATVSRTWKSKTWSFRANTNLGINYSRNIARIDKQNVETKTYSFNGRMYFSTTYKELINFMPSYSIRLSDTKFNMAQNQNPSNINHVFTTDLFINWPKRLIIENNLMYSYNSRIASGFRKGVTSWNAAANYQLFKNKRGMLRIAIYDILQQNTNVSRSITQNYIQDVQVQVLQQYYLVSFIYNLQKFGKQE